MSLPPLTLTTVAVLLGTAIVVFVVQPLLLGLSATLTGERRPTWGLSFAALVVASFASIAAQLVYGFTLGLVLARMGQLPVAVGAFGVNLLVSAIVYSAFLRISVARGAAVAAVYWLASAAWLAGVALFLKLVLF